MGRRCAELADGDRRTGLPTARAGGPGLSRRRVPERLPGLVDSHAHLQHSQFDADRDDVIGRAVAAGIERIVVPGWDIASSEAALELAHRHPRVILPAAGIHPHDAASADEAVWARLEALVGDARCVAVGEIGLDYERVISSLDAQRHAFARQLEIAARNAKPVLVHHRGSQDDVTAALLGWTGATVGTARGVLHAFSGGAEMARELAGGGYLISFALPVAFRSAVGPRAAAAALEGTALLVETDAPYLGPDRGARNEPTTALRVIAELARLREISPEAVAAEVSAAFSRLVEVA